MEPRIQYAKTSDGVSIAFYAIGQGPPLVSMSLPLAHLTLEWQNKQIRQIYEAAALTWTFVRYDSRGFGLSDREITDFGLDRMVHDLEAVADHLQLDRFVLFADSIAVPVAIAYCAQHPDRVSRLILWQGSARGGDMTNEQFDTLVTLAETNWELTSESMLHAIRGWERGEDAHEGAALLRESISPDAFRAFIRQIREWDVSAEAERIIIPALVMHPPKHRFFSVEMGRRLAALIPDARLVLVDGFGEPAALVAIAEFLGQAPPARPAPPYPSGTAVIFFADIVDSTALTERLGDTAFRDKARELDTALRAAIRERGGTPVEGKLLGDGVLAVFTSARQAIEAALACGAAGSHAGLPLHLGIHAGDVIREENNVYGGAVNIASRIAGLSAAGEVLVSETVRSLARTSAGVRFEDRGEQSLKGVGEKVRVWAVREGDS